MAIIAEATKKSEPGKRSYRRLREVRVERGDGGVMVHHHHSSSDGAYHEPGPPKVISSHKEFMEHMGHVSRKMGLAVPEGSAGAEELEESERE